MVSVSGYLIGSQEAGKMPLPPKAELEWWYQFYFATERGRAGYDKYRREFSKLIWQLASPKWKLRRRHVRSQRRGLRQSGSRRHRDSQLPLAARPGRGRAEIRRSGKAACRNSRSSPCRPSRWKAMPMARRTRSPVPTPRNSRANMSTGSSRAASGTTCRRKPRRPSPKPSSTYRGPDHRRVDDDARSLVIAQEGEHCHGLQHQSQRQHRTASMSTATRRCFGCCAMCWA